MRILSCLSCCSVVVVFKCIDQSYGADCSAVDPVCVFVRRNFSAPSYASTLNRSTPEALFNFNDPGMITCAQYIS